MVFAKYSLPKRLSRSRPSSHSPFPRHYHHHTKHDKHHQTPQPNSSYSEQLIKDPNQNQRPGAASSASQSGPTVCRTDRRRRSCTDAGLLTYPYTKDPCLLTPSQSSRNPKKTAAFDETVTKRSPKPKLQIPKLKPKEQPLL